MVMLKNACPLGHWETPSNFFKAAYLSRICDLHSGKILSVLYAGEDKEDSFIPASLSEEETPATKTATLGPLSSEDIERIFQELIEPGTIDIRDSESTVSAREHHVHSRHAPDIKVEETGEDWEIPERA
uniref:Uncharacterized protein n=1 Tax=Cannabis sativa TaxID=3483 RepID=A0A803PKW5_CANSA